MNVDDWLDQQEQTEKKEKFKAAFSEATDAGVDTLKVVSDSLDGYRGLKKQKLSRILVDQNILSEIDAMILALTNATKKKREEA